MFTAAQLVAFVISMIGMPYWYGCCVYQCTQSRLESKARQYPEHYKSVRMPKYMQAIAKRQVCMDCIGMIKGFFWTNGGKGVVEYINGGVTYKIWVEDATSLEEKLKVMQSNQLAGGAFWKLGLEDPAVWDTIIKYIN